MNKKTDNTMLYIGSSVAILFLGIMVVFFIDKSKSASPSDIRAKAGVTTGLQYEGIVNTVDSSNNSLTVDNLKPSDNPEKTIGTWTVILPSTFSSSAYSLGTSVVITVEAKNFDIKTSTMIAKAIEVK